MNDLIWHPGGHSDGKRGQRLEVDDLLSENPKLVTLYRNDATVYAYLMMAYEGADTVTGALIKLIVALASEKHELFEKLMKEREK